MQRYRRGAVLIPSTFTLMDLPASGHRENAWDRGPAAWYGCWLLTLFINFFDLQVARASPGKVMTWRVDHPQALCLAWRAWRGKRIIRVIMDVDLRDSSPARDYGRLCIVLDASVI